MVYSSVMKSHNDPIRDAILEALSRAGGTSKVAQHFGVTRQAVAKWPAAGRVPAGRVLPLAALSGMPAHALAPHLYPPSSFAVVQ